MAENYAIFEGMSIWKKIDNVRGIHYSARKQRRFFMKKYLLALVALAVPMAVLATSPYTTSFKQGKYEGAFQSIVPQLNGQKAAVEVKTVGENVEATVVTGGPADASKEVWTWNDKQLIQKEFDPKTNQVVKTYTATAEKPATGSEQVYKINCKDRAKNQCDADIDGRNYWTIRALPDGFEYLVFGVPGTEKNNPAASTVRKHTLTLKLAK